MFRKVFCLILAIALTGAAALVIFTGDIQKAFPEWEIKIPYIDVKAVDIHQFPFYGGDEEGGNFGVYDVVKSYSGRIKDENAPTPDFNALMGKITSRADFTDSLYAFLLVSLLTIPVYMVVRLIVFNGAYELGKKWFFLFRYLYFGFVTLMAAFVTVTATWVMYKTVVYDIVLAFLTGLMQEVVKNVQVALATTNILTIAIIGVLVCLLLHRTLFRGSVFLSLVGAILRSALFVIIVACVNIFLYDGTLRVYLFALAALFAVGLIKAVLLPDKHTS